LEISRCFSLHRHEYEPLWYESKPLNLSSKENDEQVINKNKLFIFNHFFGVNALKTSINANTVALMNTKEFILKRLDAKCNQWVGFKRPNFIALDFIDKNTYKDVIVPMNKLN
jgi:hypothetical protein